MDCRDAVLLLSAALLASIASLAPAHAADIKIAGELLPGSLNLSITNLQDYNVTFRLDAQLKLKGDAWKLVSRLDCSGNYSVSGLGSAVIACDYARPNGTGSYKIYVRAVVANGPGNGTFTYKDFLFSVGDSGFALPKPKENVSITFLSAPEEAKTGEQFEFAINVTSRVDAELEVYSYVYAGKTCFSLRGWTGNKLDVALSAGESRVIVFQNIVSGDAPNGTYLLKVRARCPSCGQSGRDFDASRPIIVVQVPPDLEKEIPESKRGAPYNPTAPQPDLLLPLLGSVPLIIILLKKIL